MSWRNWKGPEAEKMMAEVNRAAVMETCFKVLALSKTEVPLHEGTLMRSGRVFLAPEPEAAGVVSYGGGPGTGGPIVPYALPVHETDRAYQRGRKWHYLKDPFDKLAESSLRDGIEKHSKNFK